jgi:hypothetical protein
MHVPAALQQRVDIAQCVHLEIPAEYTVKKGVASVQPSDTYTGAWWMSSPKFLCYYFVPYCSRVFQKWNYDTWLLSQMEPRKEPNWTTEIVSDLNRKRLHDWFVKKAQLQTANAFNLLFRDMSFENTLPFNSIVWAASRQNKKATKITAPTSLVEIEFGFHPLLRIYHLTMAKPFKDMAADKAYELHGILLLTMFSYMIKQMAKINFLSDYYFGNQRVQGMQIDNTCKWGKNIRPRIAEIHKKLYVIDPSGPDRREESAENRKKFEYVYCKDIYEALLYWLYLMKTKYAFELLCMTRITKFYNSIFPPPEQQN